MSRKKSNAATLARRIIERLSEDERLRGGLTDEGYEPLLTWAVEAVQQYAAAAPRRAALEAFGDRLREALDAAVASAEAGQLIDPEVIAGPFPTEKDRALAALRAVRFEADLDINARQIAAVLQAVLKAAPADPRKEGHR